VCGRSLHENAIIVDFIHDVGSVLDAIREEARIDEGRRQRLVEGVVVPEVLGVFATCEGARSPSSFRDLAVLRESPASAGAI
jgi:hypothetical protein